MCVQEMSQILITILKTSKTLLAVRPKNWTKRKKEKKNRMAMAKLFALNTNTMKLYKAKLT